MRPQRIPVASEGLPFIALGALSSVVFAQLGWSILAVTGFAVTTFILYFFRDPERVIPTEDGVVVSPADGRVLDVAEGGEGALQDGRTQRISIFMNIFDVHVNRAPIRGAVKQIVYRQGSFLSADKARARLQNEQNALLIEGDDATRLTVVQVAGVIARRIVCWADVGDTLELGQRFGMIRFGSRLDMYLPAEMSVVVRRGQRVRAGETVLAKAERGG